MKAPSISISAFDKSNLSINSKYMTDLDRLLLSRREARCDCDTQVLIVDDSIFNLITLEIIIKDLYKIKVDKALNG